MEKCGQSVVSLLIGGEKMSTKYVVCESVCFHKRSISHSAAPLWAGTITALACGSRRVIPRMSTSEHSSVSVVRDKRRRDPTGVRQRTLNMHPNVSQTVCVSGLSVSEEPPPHRVTTGPPPTDHQRGHSLQPPSTPALPRRYLPAQPRNSPGGQLKSL